MRKGEVVKDPKTLDRTEELLNSIGRMKISIGTWVGQGGKKWQKGKGKGIIK